MTFGVHVKAILSKLATFLADHYLIPNMPNMATVADLIVISINSASFLWPRTGQNNYIEMRHGQKREVMVR